MMMLSLTIGKIAKSAGVGVETIRFYERQGLIDMPPRRASGYRQFPPQTVDRILFIRRAKELGFSLKEIKQLLELRIDPQATCAQVRDRTLTKISDIRDKIKTLQRMERALEALASACTGEGSVSDCPILDALKEGTGA